MTKITVTGRERRRARREEDERLERRWRRSTATSVLFLTAKKEGEG